MNQYFLHLPCRHGFSGVFTLARLPICNRRAIHLAVSASPSATAPHDGSRGRSPNAGMKRIWAIVFSITNPEWTPLRNEAICTALGLEIGATLAATVRISPQVPPITLYAHKEIADRILDLPKAAGMRVKAQTIIGVAKYPHFSDEGTIIEKNPQSGLLIIEILSAQALGSRA
jgi:hypothetical protein